MLAPLGCSLSRSSLDLRKPTFTSARLILFLMVCSHLWCFPLGWLSFPKHPKLSLFPRPSDLPVSFPISNVFT
ncbi:rCG24728 [Rattus norvegicus]|uniref:RCG24728 n=1 Tax=Rattus norvegicus TaxID=10116 RepID=A6JBJ8_RAT|nr:rCG24728 [Rattus norvegicus]